MFEIKFLDHAEFAARNEELRPIVFKGSHFQEHFSATPATDGVAVVAIPALQSKEFELWLRSGNAAETESEKSVALHRFYEFENSDSPGLKQPAYRAYQKLFSELANRNRNLLRIWNYIPHILGENENLERYRQFNIGRHDAWAEFGPKDFEGRPIFPAATGIGAVDGPVMVECLTTVHPVRHLQNPRQTPAHLYSVKYGPRPPVFARATLHLPPGFSEIYISGTASLLGEDVVWPGDARKQAQEAMRNIEVLIGAENLRAENHPGFLFSDIVGLRVYIKHPQHLETIRAEVEKFVDPAKIIYLHDDICRQGFLVEIEGLARRVG